ncbi:Aryl-phospho-beta-D-glucosidase BglC, GH1 family [Mucilaginibacter sp. OK268]|uniref:cellulase family glycosylhydrolase n=1 Tax=Mucilaginibacter sp. OK268 TaxID=1881048 RepID=UPI000890B674|nr:cellulase family glycosylhydrolase [Mucilaginibacter sp. OK268]SDP28855.1 Aryl-phospho-beta-D-glucosidase BglC, GH1 family [Mucilaginibacter sp. OK268]
MRTVNYFYCIAIMLVVSGCHKQQMANPPVNPLVKTGTKTLTATSYPSYNTSPLPPDQTGMSSTAVQIASRIQLGFNIGNTMEAVNNENGWGAPNITQAFIDKVKQSGFTAIRIPCNWNWSHVPDSTTSKIDPAWLSRVQQVVQYCVNDGLYVILNIHWDGGWLDNNITTAAQAAVNAKQKALWEQIATQMRGFDEHLLFASANEPPAADATGMSILLSYHQTFINAVRSTGGHNSYRTLVIQGPSTDIVKTNSLMNTLPSDPASNRMMVEVHYYTPYNFCLMDGDASWGNMFYYWGSGYHSTTDPSRNATYGEESDLNGYFQSMKTKFVNQGIPVVLGEFAAGRRSSLTGDAYNLHIASRAYWYNYVIHQALLNGMLPFLWDTGSIIDRSTYAVKDQQQLAAMVQGAQSSTSPGIQAGSVYQIVNRYSFKALDIAGWGTANQTLADQWDYSAGSNQQFKVQPAGSGYLLTPMHTSGKCLEINGWSNANGGFADLWAYTGTGGNNQNWLIQPTDNGYYKIINVNSGKALEVAQSSLANGGALDQWDYNGGKNQQWAFLKL